MNPHNGWRADSVLAASAEAGREFDKLATDLTTPRDSLTREVNLVVSLSRTPPVNYVSQPEPSVTQLRQVFAICIAVFANGALRPSTSLC